MSRTTRSLVAALVALSVGAAACGNDTTTVAGENGAGRPPGAEAGQDDTAHLDGEDHAGATGEGVDSGAAELRAGLTHLLTEHVYLAGVALNTAVSTGPESRETEAAVGTLDANSQDLAAAVGSVYGAEGGEQFLALWREHIDMFVAYTLARAEGDEAGQQVAREDLDGYRSEFGAFLESATEGNLPADAVADALTPHVESVIAAIDAAVDGSPEVFDRLRVAAGHMPHTAETLAGGIVAQFPEKF